MVTSVQSLFPTNFELRTCGLRKYVTLAIVWKRWKEKEKCHSRPQAASAETDHVFPVGNWQGFFMR